MKKHCGAALGILILLSSVCLAADKQLNACSLLTAGEIEAVTGGNAEPHETNMPVKSGSEMATMVGCMWQVGKVGMISVSTIQGAQGVQRDAAMAQVEQVFNELKSKGWNQERKDYAGIQCMTFTPPPKEKDAPISTSCMGEARGRAISVGWLGISSKVSIENVKSLYDKAAARLP